MAILNYTTKIDTFKTIGEIQQILVKHGANKIICDYKDNLPVGMTFHIEYGTQPIFFSLPCNWEGVLKVLENESKVPRPLKTKEQALRVSWRILKDWIEAQCAIIEAGLATTVQVFLPYAVTKGGATVYERMIGEDRQLLLT